MARYTRQATLTALRRAARLLRLAAPQVPDRKLRLRMLRTADVLDEISESLSGRSPSQA